MKKKKDISAVLPPEYIAQRIYLIRSQKVMLDADLAVLYGISTKHLNQAVQRNIERFPEDFMFTLHFQEFRNLKSQFVTSSLHDADIDREYGGRRKPPSAFTEHGVAMLSSILRSERAVQMNIMIIRIFVRLRNLLATNKDLAARVEKLEARQAQHGSIIEILAEEIEALKLPPEPAKKRRIGYI